MQCQLPNLMLDLKFLQNQKSKSHKIYSKFFVRAFQVLNGPCPGRLGRHFKRTEYGAYLIQIPSFHNLYVRVWLHSKIKEAMMLRASQLASPVLCAITQSLIPTLNLSSSSSLSIFQKPPSFASFYKSLNPASNSNSFHIHIISRSFASPKGTFVIVYIHNFILC